MKLKVVAFQICTSGFAQAINDSSVLELIRVSITLRDIGVLFPVDGILVHHRMGRFRADLTPKCGHQGALFQTHGNFQANSDTDS